MRHIAMLFALIGICAFAQTNNIDGIAANDNAKCPVEISKGITLTSVSVSPEKDAIIYNMIVDDTMVPFANLKQQSDMLRDMKAMEISTATDPNQVALRSACITGNINIVYDFRSGDEAFSYTITPAELQ